MSFDVPFKKYGPDGSLVLIGEILVDVIEDTGNKKTVTSLGGSPANIAVGCTQLGIPCHFFGSVGNDESAVFLRNEINKERVLADIATNEYPTSVVHMDKNIFSPSPRFARSVDYRIEFSDSMKNAIASTSILHFSFWPLSKKPGRTTILRAIDLAKQENITIGFDPNYHPLLDDQSRSGLSVLLDVMQKVDIVKPSLDDSFRIFGKRLDPSAYLDLYEKMGIPLIIMTLGKDGLVCRYEGETLWLDSLASEIVDSTGAGDAFWSGLYSGLLHNDSLKDSLKLGLMASSLSLATVGANCHLPTYDQLRILLEKRG